MRQVLFDAHDAKIQVHFVVVGSEVAIADGPVFAVTVTVLGLEVVIGQAQSESAPNVGLSTQAARANPGVVRAGIGIFALVDANVFGVVAVADVTVQMLGFFKARTMRRPADGVLVEAERMSVRRQFAAVPVVVRPLHRAKFVFNGKFLPRL